MKRKPEFLSLDLILTGQRIHSIIFGKGYSVKEIQEILNLACPQSVYRWMHGYSFPSVDNLYMLSRLFDMHMEDFLVEKGQESKKDKLDTVE